MSERSDQVQKVLAVLARHADIVAEAFEGAVSGGDRQHQKGVDALFEIGAIMSWSSLFGHSDRGCSFKLSELPTPAASRSHWVTGIPAWSAT